MQQLVSMKCAFHVVAFTRLFAIVESAQLRARSQETEQFFAYDYSQHGQDWVAGSCSSRDRQSPIDLPASAPSAGSFTYKYKPIATPFDFLNNGHTFAADIAGLNYGGIVYKDAWYDLLNINIHSLSEHSWVGQRKPLELHLVHKHYAKDSILIVAVAIESATPLNIAQLLQVNSSAGSLRKRGEQGPGFSPFEPGYKEPPSTDANFNAAIQAFVRVQPPAVNTKVSVPMSSDSTLDVSVFLQGGDFYEYAGSLTAPPCAEIATWLVRKDPLMASDKQVVYLHDAIYKTTADFGNYRVLMPLSSRTVTMRRAVIEDMPPSARPAVPMAGAPQQSDREFRAMKWAMDAMTIAKGATDYIKDLDMRLRNAAQAHADALAPGLEPLEKKPNMEVAIPEASAGQGISPMGAVPIEMENTAKQMTRALAEAARQEIDDATETMEVRAKAAALKAAKEAAGIVSTGTGDTNALASSVPGPPPQLSPSTR